MAILTFPTSINITDITNFLTSHGVNRNGASQHTPLKTMGCIRTLKYKKRRGQIKDDRQRAEWQIRQKKTTMGLWTNTTIAWKQELLSILKRGIMIARGTLVCR
jgi:hypothetical protein